MTTPFAAGFLLVSLVPPPADRLPARLGRAVVSHPQLVTCAGKPTIELRLRRDAPELRSTPTASERFALQRSAYPIRPGAFVGVARIPAPWTDSRGQTVPAGTYSLRYALQPLTKDHFGTTPHRDFLLLLPLARDTDPALRPDPTALGTASREVSATGHPAVIALLPADRDEPTATRAHAGEVEILLALCGS